jgi:hypothetical protein
MSRIDLHRMKNGINHIRDQDQHDQPTCPIT